MDYPAMTSDWDLPIYIVYLSVNPTPKHAGSGFDSPSDLPSQMDYSAMISYWD